MKAACTLVHSPHHDARLATACAWLESRVGAPTLVVTPDRDAAELLVERAEGQVGTSLGWVPLSLDDLAERMARPAMTQRGLRRASTAERMAVVRVALEACDDTTREHLAPRGATAARQRSLLGQLEAPADDSRARAALEALRGAYRSVLERLGLLDAPSVRALAAQEGASTALAAVLVVDPPLGDDATQRLVAAALAGTPQSLVVAPTVDARALGALADSLGAPPPRLAPQVATAERASPRGGVPERLAARGPADAAVEIASLCIDAIAEGASAARIAVVGGDEETVRLTCAALARAGVAHEASPSLALPAIQWRALRALLRCAAEHVSATRIGEFLALGVLPFPSEGEGSLARSLALERVLREARVIGGLTRWRARTAHFRRERELDVDAARALGDPRAEQSARERLVDSRAVESSLLPIVTLLDDLRTLRAPFDEWRRRLETLAALALDDRGRSTRALFEWLSVARDASGDLEDVLALVDVLASTPCDDRRAPARGVRLGSRALLTARSFDRAILVEGDASDPHDADLERAVAYAADRVVTVSCRDARSGLPREDDGRALQSRAALEDARRALDESDVDAAILTRLARRAPEEAAGGARYVIETSTHAARALRRRARRALAGWTRADGLVDPSPSAQAALEPHHPSRRSFSPTALQHFSACPYRFYLSALLRLTRREQVTPLVRMDALRRGTLVHETLYTTLVRIREIGGRVSEHAGEGALRRELDDALDAVAARFEDDLSPLAPALYADVVRDIRADLHGWAARIALEAGYEPRHFELSFGLRDRRASDPASRIDDVALDCGLRVRGSIDLVERSTGGAVRATDFKTGKVRATPATVIDGGATLQPVLYALVLEKVFPGESVEGGRLYYCTEAGSFTSVFIPLDARAREAFDRVASTIASALERGFFPAAPAERACLYCDFLELCGPGEPARALRKRPEPLASLTRLRSLP